LHTRQRHAWIQLKFLPDSREPLDPLRNQSTRIYFRCFMLQGFVEHLQRVAVRQTPIIADRERIFVFFPPSPCIWQGLSQ
jgi:hypothetical protein